MLFRGIAVGDYDKIQHYCDQFGENSCQHSFINMFTLSEKYGSQYCEEDGFLYVLRSRLCGDGFRTYLFPMGDGNRRAAVEHIIEDAHSHQMKTRFQTVTEKKREWLHQEFPDTFVSREIRDYAEYLHLSSNLACLPGRKFSGKRSEAKKMRRMYEGRMEETLLCREAFDEVFDFEKKWLEVSQKTHDAEALRLEYREIEKQLANFETLRISGLILRIDGVIQGFVYGAPISENCYDVLIEKGNREIPHIYRILHQDIVRMCAMDYMYINREEDVGVPGLRASKLSYKPDILLSKYIVEEK